MRWNENTMICTYRVREGCKDQFLKLLKQHWETLRDAGLATEEPAVHFEAVSSAKEQHDEQGVTFVEIFSWVDADSSDVAHRSPEVMAIWEPMGGLVEARGGRPPMEFHRYRPLNFGD